MTKVLIVGGVAGGATAATRLRRLDEAALHYKRSRLGSLRSIPRQS